MHRKRLYIWKRWEKVSSRMEERNKKDGENGMEALVRE